MKRTSTNAVLFYLVVPVLAGGLLGGCVKDSVKSDPSLNEATSEENQAIELAVEVYDRAVEAGVDLSNGPCIDDNLMEGWVADVAHDPREDTDNLPENQCPSYGDTASHFVELDPEGNLIRVR